MRYREVVERLERSNKEIGKRFDKDDMLERRLTQDQLLSLLSIRRLKSYLLFRENPQE